MPTQFGLLHFWQQGDSVIHVTALILLLLSVLSWALIVGRFTRQLRINLASDRAPAAFWQARTLAEALAAIEAADRTGLYAGMARAGARESQAYGCPIIGDKAPINPADFTNCSLCDDPTRDRCHASRSIGAGVSLSESVTRALRNQMLSAQASLETGLTFLASVGSTAPFIGLFGTVWGIYHALVALSGSTSVVLDKVAGPVGEALIMTAAGLFVAIPAVLAYNALTRANRLTLAQLDGFAHDLHAFFTTGARRPASVDYSTPRAVPEMAPQPARRAT
ncbi:MAG: MotA/TolQ/ExbB proton channel family protein [Sulfuritalea sp.]|nr:MotA/TolQ/ExbB proton channel family protein [Sulfuritalea sp.]